MDQVIIPATVVVPPVGHDEAMIAKVDAIEAKNAPTAVVRPDWLPEKFATVEEMAASYKELESKLGAPKVPEVAPVVPPVADPKAALEITPPEATAEAAVAKAGLDMAALRAEFAASGALSDASKAALLAAGFDQPTVDSYIAGQQALSNQYDADVKSAVPGGAEKFEEFVTWAKANATPAELAVYNAAVGSGDVNQAKLAVAGLGARFQADVGSEPNLLGGRTAADVGDVFESTAQVTAAMKDPQYKADPAYRAKVQAKLGRSSVF